MSAARVDSPDWRERFQATQDLGRSQAGHPEVLQALLQSVRDEALSVACEAARSLALLGDRSVLPRLIEERQAVIAEWNSADGLVDASEARREAALTMAIISLLTPAECETLFETGTEDEKWLVRRKRAVASIEEFWGPIRG